MSKIKRRVAVLIVATVALVSLATTASADYCGETCLSCEITKKGTIICCVWLAGHFEGCYESE